MATPITHIALTDKVFDKHFQDKNKKDFFIGTSFPDIGFLKVINREKTHFLNIRIDGLKNKASFEAGLKFHSLLDKVREEFIVSKNVYPLYPQSEYITKSLKFLEDELLYDKIDDRDTFINFMDEILSEELSFNISEKAIQKWHKILQGYLSQKPNDYIREKFMIEIGFSKDVVNGMNNLLNQIRFNKKINQIIEELYNNFEFLIK